MHKESKDKPIGRGRGSPQDCHTATDTERESKENNNSNFGAGITLFQNLNALLGEEIRTEYGGIIRHMNRDASDLTLDVRDSLGDFAFNSSQMGCGPMRPDIPPYLACDPKNMKESSNHALVGKESKN